MKNLVLPRMKLALAAVLLVLAALPARPARAALTRFYMQNAVSPVTTADQGTWQDAAGVPTLVMSQTKSGAVSSRALAETSATSGYSVLLLKLVSEPILAQAISGTLNWTVGALEDSNPANLVFKIHAYVTSNDGTTLRGTLLSNDVDTNEWPTSAGGRTPTAAKTLTEVSAQANDRIVIEIGYAANNTQINSHTGALWYGGTGGDMTAGGATTLTGWFEFSNLATTMVKPSVDTFTASSPSNSHSIPITAFTASDDIGVSGYMISESATPPAAGDPGWTGTAPTIYTVATDGSYTLYPWAKDGDGNVSNVFGSPRTVVVDTTRPVVDTFTAASPSNSHSIPITAFTASDTVGVTGYMISVSSAPPAAGDPGWTGTAPATYTVLSDGSYTLHPWAKDGAGNVSNVFGSPVTVVVDATRPGVDDFTATSPSNSLTIPITAFSATDNVGVSGYMITVSAASPAAGDPGWTGTAPATYTVLSDGTYTLHPWAKDAAGNVSNVFGSPRTVVVDTTRPSVETFTAASATNSLAIPITAFTASDAVGVTGYMITESATPPTAGDSGWTVTAPTAYAVLSDGSHSLYPWAMDGIGNVSGVFASPVTVMVDTASPSIVSILRLNTNPTGSASVNFKVTFSEAVTGVDVGDFLLSRTGQITGESVTGVSGGPVIYTVTASTGTGEGTLRLDVPAEATITDLVTNVLSGLPYTGGETYTIQRIFRLFLPLIMR